MDLRKKKPEPVLYWHPNFRVVASLPDIKQVRTGFIVNFIAIFLALVALIFTLYFEIQIYKTNAELGKYNDQIGSIKPINDIDLVKSAKFVNGSKSLQFAAKFFSQKLSPLDVMASLLDARPKDILFDSVDIQTITLDFGAGKKADTQRVTIGGTLNSPNLLSLDDFENKLKNSPVFKSRITGDAKDFKVDPKGDPTVGVFTFTITITLKPPL
jgi:hypothetical protein